MQSTFVRLMVGCLAGLLVHSVWAVDAGDAGASLAEVSAGMTPPSETTSPSLSLSSNIPGQDEEVKKPWDYSPYQVLVWLVSDDPTITVETLEQPLRLYLDRDFSAVWRLHFSKAPSAVATAAKRDIHSLSYDLITAADPVLAVKRNHPEAVRIRIAKNVAEYVQQVYGTTGRIEEVRRRAAAAGNESIDGVDKRLKVVDGDAMKVASLWADEATEALLVSRGMASTLTEPEAKLISPKLTGLVSQAIENYDKIFIVRVHRDQVPNQIDVAEFDTLMRHFGPVATVYSATLSTLADKIGLGLTKAFAPVVRIDNAGQRNAVGLLRAGGLVLDQDSPAAIGVDDVLEPMIRKNDRNGTPILIGPMDFAFLLVTELEGRNIKMDFYAGRAGGLQGRRNSRTFRTALKVRPFGESTLLRLHLQRDPDFPLIGYELYEKELKSTSMTFIGRTDWDGRLEIERSEDPFRLLYVKNGGAVLARLPIVPGLQPKVVADLSGDDMRLQAEAYIRGVQNAIIDLVAIRELFKARIRLRLERGEMEKAENLMNALREQPSNEKLATAMGKKQTDFLKALGNKNANQRRKIDEMFATTRDLLAKHINPKLVRDLESDLISAKKNGGKLPPQKEPQDDTTDAPASENSSAGEAQNETAATE